jgi:hypothetical protein
MAYINNSDTGLSVRNKLNNQLGTVINVLDYAGVDPASGGDSTAGIQLAINDAFGTEANPHSVESLTQTLNKTLIIPAGRYHVTSSFTPRTVSACTIAGAATGTGPITYTLNSTTGIVNGNYLYFVGLQDHASLQEDGDCVQVNGSKRVNLGPGANQVTTLRNYTIGGASGGYLSGGECRRPCLLVSGAFGLTILGAGKGATELFSDTPGSIILGFNGMHSCWVQGIHFASQGGADPNGQFPAGMLMDNTGEFVGSQNNTVANCIFDTAPNNVQSGPAHGIEVFPSQYSQGSECTFIENEFVGLTYGMRVARFKNQNGVQHTIIGGNFQACTDPIHAPWGAVEVIQGVGFQTSSGADIRIDNTADDTITIVGCRTESDNFVNVGGADVAIISCTQAGGSVSTRFYTTQDGTCTIIGSRVGKGSDTNSGGQIVFGVNGGTVIGCRCNRNASNWLGNDRACKVYSKNLILNYIAGRVGVDDAVWQVAAAGAVTQINLAPAATATTVAGLPPSPVQGQRGLVTDSTATLATGLGNIVAGTGGNIVPVYHDGTNWRIG